MRNFTILLPNNKMYKSKLYIDRIPKLLTTYKYNITPNQLQEDLNERTGQE